MRNRGAPAATEVLVVELTCGDRNHRALADTETEGVQALQEVLHRRAAT